MPLHEYLTKGKEAVSILNGFRHLKLVTQSEVLALRTFPKVILA